MLSVVLGTTASGAASPPASPASREEAKRHFELGRHYFNVQVYDKAVDEFRAAYLAYPNPVFLYNIGQALRLSGQREQALAAYERYLEEVPRAPDRNEVKATIQQLREELRRLGPTQPLEPQPPVQQPPPQSAVQSPSPVQHAPTTPRDRRGPLLLAVGSTGAAAALSGVGLLIAARVTISQYRRAYEGCFGQRGDIACGDPTLGRLPARLQTLKVAGSVLLGVGGAAAALGGYFWWRHHGERPKVSFAPVPLAGGAAFGVSGVLP